MFEKHLGWYNWMIAPLLIGVFTVILTWRVHQKRFERKDASLLQSSGPGRDLKGCWVGLGTVPTKECCSNSHPLNV